MKLSKPQFDMLEQARRKLKQDNRNFRAHPYTGWFIPELHEQAEVYGRKSTCKSLCAKGLLEYRPYCAGEDWLEFRITQDGIDWLWYQDQQKQYG